MRIINSPCFCTVCVLFLFMMCLGGCFTTSPIQKIPNSSEAFLSSNDQIRIDYPEIAEYEKIFRGFMPNTPYAQQLIDEWGEPDKTRTNWSYAGYMGATLVGCGFLIGPTPALITTGIVITIRPYPPEHHYWKKNDYCIEAIIDHTFNHLYRNRLIYWRWHHISDVNNIPIECK